MLHALCECSNMSVSSYLLVLCHGMGESKGLKRLLSYSGKEHTDSWLLQLVFRGSRENRDELFHLHFTRAMSLGGCIVHTTCTRNAHAKLCYKLGIMSCSHCSLVHWHPTCTYAVSNGSKKVKKEKILTMHVNIFPKLTYIKTSKRPRQ